MLLSFVTSPQHSLRTLRPFSPLLTQHLAHRTMASNRQTGNAPDPAAAQGAVAAAPPSAAAPAASNGRSSKRQRLLAPPPPGTAPAPSNSAGSKPAAPRKAAGPAAPASRGPPAKEPGPGTLDLGGGAGVEYRTDLLPAAEAGRLFDQLRRELPWEQRNVRVMGRTVAQPRLIAYMADGPELQYTYSGATLAAQPWHPAVAALKRRVEAAAGPGVAFNSCLLNYYRSGADSIAWHSDNEAVYGSRPTIASVSLGAAREFMLRRNSNHRDKYRFRLGGGALLVMSGAVQEQWMHSVPRRPALVGERISLTFRRILFPERQ